MWILKSRMIIFFIYFFSLNLCQIIANSQPQTHESTSEVSIFQGQAKIRKKICLTIKVHIEDS